MWLADTLRQRRALLLRVILDDNGKTIREVWVDRTQDGYLTSE